MEEMAGLDDDDCAQNQSISSKASSTAIVQVCRFENDEDDESFKGTETPSKENEIYADKKSKAT